MSNDSHNPLRLTAEAAQAFANFEDADDPRILFAALVRDLQGKFPAWQPIDTAPKDGTKILAVDSSGDIAVVKWDTVSMSTYNDKGWQISCVATDWNYYESMSDPTHWMPLPQPPAKPAA